MLVKGPRASICVPLNFHSSRWSCSIRLHFPDSWWRHQMETFSALLAIGAGNSPVTGEFPHKGQWRGALMFSLICAWKNGWVNNREAGALRRQCAHYDVIVMFKFKCPNHAYRLVYLCAGLCWTCHVFPWTNVKSIFSFFIWNWYRHALIYLHGYMKMTLRCNYIPTNMVAYV